MQIKSSARWEKVCDDLSLPFFSRHYLSFYFHIPSSDVSTTGTFGRVLECWDREKCEPVAIKVVRSIRKYRYAAMIEIDVLHSIAKNDRGRSWYV